MHSGLPMKNAGRIAARPKKINPLILAMIALVLVLSLASPVSAAVLDGHFLGRPTETYHEIEPTLEFVRDDIVGSKVLLSSVEEGDLLEWTFTGPQGWKYTDSQSLSPGQDFAQAELYLSTIPSEEVVGTWTLDVSLNGVPQVQQTFSVEPLTGLVWWGPFVGLGLLVLAVVIIVVLVIGGVLVLKGVFSKDQGKNN